ncbi:MAG TPA: lasso peptide biosynthesis B2 protein [Vicinamibacterales bacterium]|jgi:hypothetical protein|nr:lasso peptide biosynthesis B2 protein [Vicinamibacterales bacterium]
MRSGAAAWAGRIRRVTAREWVVLAESAVFAIGLEVALRLLPLSTVLGAVQGRHVAGSPRPDRASLERIARLVRWPFTVLPFRATCLRIALVQVAVLRRRRVPATVRFGVQRRNGHELEFHAWADCDGAIDDQAGAAAYRAFEPVTPAAITRNARWLPPAAPPDAAA